MPRTKVKKVVPTEQIKSEPVETDSINEFTLHTIIERGDKMKSAIKELINKKRQEVKSVCDMYRKQLSELSNVPVKGLEVSTIPNVSASTPPTPKKLSKVGDNADILRSKANTTVDKNKNIHSEFQTPYNPMVVSSFNTVTPKVPPNIPLALLRRPKMGEMIMSLNGSPIMPNSADSEAASVNIPMVDGSVMTIIPEEVLPTEDLSLHVDPQAKEHLKILYNRLKCIVDDEV